MRLIGNISIMTLSHLIVNGLAFLSVPFLISHFGAQAFAAIAFYLAFQMWLVTFDLGFTPALIRELGPRLIESDGAADGIVALVSTYRSLFMLSACCIILSFSTFFVVNQTFVRFLSSSLVGFSILVALIGGLRFYVTVEKSLYRASESFARLAVLNAIFGILRYVLVFPFMGDSQSLVLFFQYQFFIAIIEVLAYPLFNNKVKHEFQKIFKPKFALISASKELIGYSAIAGLMWLAIVNVDKFFLFGSVSDTTYSHYTVLLQFASLPMLLLAPISGVVQPRVAAIMSDGGDVRLIRFLMRYNAALIAFVTSMAMFIGIVFPLFFPIWVGELLPKDLQGLIIIYLLGYSFLSHGMVTYLVQFAFKDLRFHGLSHLLIGVVYLPMVAFFSAGGELRFIGFSWFLMTAMLSQAGGVYVAARMLSMRVALVFLIPAWCIWALTGWIITIFDGFWLLDNKSEASTLFSQNIVGVGILTLCIASFGMIVFLLLVQIFQKSGLASEKYAASSRIEI
jgi:O-antigen/teichoic acid export membrane protein